MMHLFMVEALAKGKNFFTLPERGSLVAGMNFMRFKGQTMMVKMKECGGTVKSRTTVQLNGFINNCA